MELWNYVVNESGWDDEKQGDAGVIINVNQ